MSAEGKYGKADAHADAVEKRVRAVLRQAAQRRKGKKGAKHVSVRRPFERFDVNGDGRVSRREFQRCLRSLGLNLPDADVRALIRRYDTNGDGQVSYHEFAKLMELDESDIAELAEKLRQGLRNAVRCNVSQTTLKSLMECNA